MQQRRHSHDCPTSAPQWDHLDAAASAAAAAVRALEEGAAAALAGGLRSPGVDNDMDSTEGPAGDESLMFYDCVNLGTSIDSLEQVVSK